MYYFTRYYNLFVYIVQDTYHVYLNIRQLSFAVVRTRCQFVCSFKVAHSFQAMN